MNRTIASIPSLTRRSQTSSLVSMTTVLVVLIGAYLVTVPNFVFDSDTTFYDTKRRFEMLILLVAGIGILVSSQTRTRWYKTFSQLPPLARWGLAAVLGLGSISAVSAPMPRFALLEVAHLGLLFTLAVALASAFRHRPKLATYTILGALTLSVFLYLVGFGAGYVTAIFDPYNVQGTVWPDVTNLGFDNIRFFNQVQTWTLPLIVLPALLLPSRMRVARWGVLGLAAGWWMLLFASGGRGTSLAMALSIGIVALVFRSKAWPWLKMQGQALLGATGLYYVLFEVIMGGEATVVDRMHLHSNLRLEAWQETLQFMGQDPLLGIGPMHFAYYSDVFGHPHNALLQLATEWGIPAAVLITGLAVAGFFTYASHVRAQADAGQPETQTLIGVALTCALLAGAAHAMVSGIIVMPASQVLLALVVGWAWSQLPVRREVQQCHKAWSRRVVLGSVALAVILVLCGTVPEIFNTRTPRSIVLGRDTPRTPPPVTQLASDSKFHPRFWHQGLFQYYGR